MRPRNMLDAPLTPAHTLGVDADGVGDEQTRRNEVKDVPHRGVSTAVGMPDEGLRPTPRAPRRRGPEASTTSVPGPTRLGRAWNGAVAVTVGSSTSTRPG